MYLRPNLALLLFYFICITNLLFGCSLVNFPFWTLWPRRVLLLFSPVCLCVYVRGRGFHVSSPSDYGSSPSPVESAELPFINSTVYLLSIHSSPLYLARSGIVYLQLFPVLFLVILGSLPFGSPACLPHLPHLLA